MAKPEKAMARSATDRRNNLINIFTSLDTAKVRIFPVSGEKFNNNL